MRSWVTIAVATVTLALLLPVGAAGQVENDINVTATGFASQIYIEVEMDIGGTLPPTWTGWVVERTTIGVCEPDLRIGGLWSFESGPNVYALSDGSAVSGVTYYYCVYAIDDQGVRRRLGGPPEFQPGYYHDDFASLRESGHVARGTIVDMGWTIGIEVCPDACWWWPAFVSVADPGLEALAGTGTVVDLYGTFDNEFEGPYISRIDAWTVFGSSCGPVPTRTDSWGNLKATYR